MKTLNEGEAENAAWTESEAMGRQTFLGHREQNFELVVQNIDELLHFVFADFSQELTADQAILCPDIVNDIVLDKLKSPERIYYSHTEVVAQGDAIEGVYKETLTPEYLSTLNPSSLQPHKLRLKEGCIIFLIRNMTEWWAR